MDSHSHSFDVLDSQPSLNAFMGLAKSVWTATRRSLQQILSKDEPRLRDDADLRQRVFTAQKDAMMHLPINIGYVVIILHLRLTYCD